MADELITFPIRKPSVSEINLIRLIRSDYY